MSSHFTVLVVAFWHLQQALAWTTTTTTTTTGSMARAPQHGVPFQYCDFWSWSLRAANTDNTNDDNDDDDEEDDEPPDVDISSFTPPTAAYGLNRGRSSPSQRKAMGTSGSSTARIHICSTCGSETVKWMGRCPTCKEWNTFQEHAVQRETTTKATRPLFGTSFGSSSSSSNRINTRSSSSNSNIERTNSWFSMDDTAAGPIRITDLFDNNNDDGDNDDGDNASSDPSKPNNRQHRPKRIVIPGDQELNNVLGGGIMRGSLTLIGGDPGVGKSTLLLQTAGSVASLSTPTPGIGLGPLAPAESNKPVQGPVWYVSGEENPEQIASRASRLGIKEPELWLLSETHADTLAEQIVSYLQAAPPALNSNEAILRSKPPGLVVIDSIQTMVCEAGGSSAAGGITQVKECVALFLRLAKSTGIPVILVGHVTKAGGVAGPRTVEHMVDAVLYLEGTDLGGSINLRVLRAAKNRFGSSDEVGVYEMTSGRLLPVSDPSSLFLAHRFTEEDSEGCAIAIALEGMRAITVEVQALVTPASGGGGFGRRTVDGISNSRLLLLMGVLQKRCNMFMSKQDVYINVVGRMRLDRGEGNSADLAVAMALVSSLTSIAVRSDTAFVGEVGLLGELRHVPALEKRIQEARRMGFSRVITPRDGRQSKRRKSGQRTTTASSSYGLEWIQCDTLLEAITTGLVHPLPKRKASRTSQRPPLNGASPGRLQDLGLDEIMDDDEDDDAFL